MSLYGHGGFNSQRRPPPPFPSRYVIYLWKQYLPYLAGRIFARAALHSPPGRWGLLALKQFIHCHFKETDLRSTVKFLKISFIIAILFLVCKMKLECSYINYYCMFLAELSCVKQNVRVKHFFIIYAPTLGCTVK